MRHAVRNRLRGRQARGSMPKRPRIERFSAVALAPCLVATTFFACAYDDSDWDRDQPSGATSTRGGATSAGAGKGGGGRSGAPSAGGDASEAGQAAAGAPPTYPAPRIDSFDPERGAYGSRVTIRGKGLGSRELKGCSLALGDDGAVTLTPESTGTIISWTDQEIVLRYPFPAEGAVVLTTPRGTVAAGDFQPTWHVAQEIEAAPAAVALASVSPEAGKIAILFDTMPLSLLEVERGAIRERAVVAPNVAAPTARLYLNGDGAVEGVAVSSTADPVIVHLGNQGGDLVAQPTTIELGASEFSVAGGSEGAAVWMRRSTGWFRARPSGVTWAQDKGPVADADEDAPDRASGGTSDGSLFVGWSVDTGNFLDDMEAPYMAKLAPTATKFAAAVAAGGSVDDYVTSLTLTSHGDGLVVRVCGSDVDPFGLSGTDRYCFDGLHAPGGAHLFGIPVNAKSVMHAFTHERAVAAYCHGDQSWVIRTDADVETEPSVPIGEIVAFPCPEAVALEVSGEGDYLPVVRWSGKTYLLERNPAAAPAD